MKKFLAIMLVLAMVLSMNITSFADVEQPSITITNATVGEMYYLYKFFDATYAHDEQGNNKVDANGNLIVSYTMSPDNQFFDDMFGEDGTQDNQYFIYDKNTGVVTRKEGILDTDIIAYLDSVANSDDAVPDKSKRAETSTLVFDGITTGYYLIDRGITSVVTITSNFPTVNIIDKNQKPNVNDGFSKQVWDEASGQWVSSNSANIGDIIDWKVEFTATNYDGDDEVLYYVIRDVKSPSLWVEFNSITVKVGTETLGLGYYWCAGDDSIDTDDWQAEKDATKWAETPEEADWYLIHYGFDEFEIVIPWEDDYTFTGVKSSVKGYEFTFDLDENDGNNVLSESIYQSPVDVLITYSASVGPGAANTTARNDATLDWITPEGTFGPDDPETTETRVYNLGITKTANDGTPSSAATRLEGAIFELYSDPACTQPIFVIPTNNEGVYILDDEDTVVSGSNRVDARTLYAGYWEEYIGDAEYKNVVVTPENGQIVILGLAAGTYYLKETKAPEGYNKLGTAVEVTVGTGTTGIYSNNYKDLDDNEITYSVYSTNIINNSGVELPATGGQGTIWLITIGTVIAIGFAVFLITHKKMSVYTD